MCSVMEGSACWRCLVIRHASFVGMLVKRERLHQNLVQLTEVNALNDVDELTSVGDVMLCEAA